MKCVEMNFKFFKKKSKPDSDGTLAANEELPYKPLSRSNSNDPYKKEVLKPNVLDYKLSSQISNVAFPNKSFISNENGFRNSSSLDSSKKSSVNSNHGSNPKLFDDKVLEPATSAGSPMQVKKLIKPGFIDAVQPSHLLSTRKDPSVKVHISDEYTDPFDTVPETSTTEGYTEPFKLHDSIISKPLKSNIQTSNKELLRPEDQQSHRIYDDPWDNSKKKIKKDLTDYDEPWENNSDPSRTKLPTNILMKQQGSLDSQSSRSSASRHGLVRVGSRHGSPQISPRLDKRLIKPMTSSAGESSPLRFDNRLVKAEPSLEELRHQCNSSRGSSRISSPLNQSPAGTVTMGFLRQMSSELHRSQSPLSHLQPSRLKSRSLDFRNKQQLIKKIPKSVSDDQLVHHHQVQLIAPPAQSTLGGVVEYEEPWDGGSGGKLLQIGPEQKSHVVHSRSRSYEINVRPSLLVSVHEKSNSLDKSAPVIKEAPSSSNYERPWDTQKSLAPEDHLKSMQRFQLHELELHPSEAIHYRGIDPLGSLIKQSWYHGNIKRDTAEYRLQRACDGSFLVRNSESIPNNFSLSLRVPRGTIHMSISKRKDGFWILGEFSAPFRNIAEMVKYYSDHHLKISDSNFTYLRHAVDRGTF